MTDKPEVTQETFPTDDQVWIAFDAGRAEASRWRIMDFNGRGVVAVNDLRPLAFMPPSAEPVDIAYERHHFADRETALHYIEWRAYKAALEEAIAIIAPAVLDMALQALKTAQYDPAPYTRGKSAILALKAQFQTEGEW